ncbi:putative NADH-dependent butanol dehydrogenase 1 [uncultured Pleomorphomonas sp.]|uniref:Putative NADH-dependent butanol dehydrogenase 1 n=1 Tax=uncultured Pleomorphomonas sp. TaxID=442121 RepID=A0A212L9V2_9HYPH|nr:iron-containing alcohol dehydrogenase [uncultured Pleomorphomonas sp.]SCM74351.1 putative NADH-dependent butanol dehydrogenase 1 [uncultured Pleomorphomonas sp.]
MENFTFLNPTKIVFGRDTEASAGAETARYSKKILLHYGGGSIKASGLYDRVCASLKAAGVEWVELGGVKPNPRLSLVQEGVRLCKQHGLGFILAVGGGSAIDSAKAIAMGAVIDGDVWDFYVGRGTPADALPIGTVLTIPAAGSESSDGSVITNEDGWLKRAVGGPFLYPRFSILNPALCVTLPPFQVACGAADIMAHLMERYFTNVTNVAFTDRLIEATMKTVAAQAPKVLTNPDDYDAWSELMWAGTIAHNNLLNTGRIGDWASHDIEHEVSGIYDVAHGAGLAVVFPAWMKYVLHHDIDRFVQWAVRVWNVDLDVFDKEATAREGIARLEAFFHRIGLGTTLASLGIHDDRIDEMAQKGTNDDSRTLGQFVKLDSRAIADILRLAR